MNSQSSPTAPLSIAAVLFVNRQGRILTVRKRNTKMFMFPGGKVQPGEDPLQAAIREAAEEIRVTLTPDQLQHIGTYECAAANEPDQTINANVFQCRDNLAVAFPGAEIVELAWVSPRTTDVPLAPLLAEHVFPALLNHRAPQ